MRCDKKKYGEGLPSKNLTLCCISTIRFTLDTLIPSSWLLPAAALESSVLRVFSVLSWLPPGPEWIQSLFLSWSLWLWGRARSYTMPDPVTEVRTQCHVLWAAFLMGVIIFLITSGKDMQERGLQNRFRELQGLLFSWVQNEGEDWEGDSWQRAFYCNEVLNI